MTADPITALIHTPATVPPALTSTERTRMGWYAARKYDDRRHTARHALIPILEAELDAIRTEKAQTAVQTTIRAALAIAHQAVTEHDAQTNPTRRTDPATESLISYLHRAGCSDRDVAAEVGLSPSGVRKVRQRHVRQNMPRTGQNGAQQPRAATGRVPVAASAQRLTAPHREVQP